MDQASGKEQAVRRRPAGWKVAAVLLGIVALTPVWIAFGLLGKLLTAPSSLLSRFGVSALAALAIAAFVQVLVRIDSLEAAEDAVPARDVAIVVSAMLLALLLAQWKLHRLVMFCVDLPPNSPNAVSRLIDVVAPAFFVLMMKGYVASLPHWKLVSRPVLYAFAIVYLLLPAIVAISHAKLWIPARVSKLEQLEHDLIKKNMKRPFHQMKIAGLGTVHVPCTDRKKVKSSSEKPKTVVLVHGFAAGNALWACNLAYLARTFDVYAIEWLGTGRSLRPEFPSYDRDQVDTVMVDAIEEWRKELKIDKFYLCGHSMGVRAMFCSSYAVKYPSRVEHLVLVSPAGVGQPPPPGPLSFGIRVFRFIWNFRLTPMSVARYAGPFGPAFVRLLASLRSSVMPPTSAIRQGRLPVKLIGDYWYHNWALKKSGEIAMHSHLLPGVFARKPLCEILTPKSIQIPITFLYGGGPDWMDRKHGDELAATFEGHQRVEVLSVPLAGHQVFMDNALAFNRMLVTALVGKEVDSDDEDPTIVEDEFVLM